jgi:protein-tyrosine phosphatase
VNRRPGDHHHLQDITAGLALRPGVLFRTGWTLVSGCPAAVAEAAGVSHHVDLRSRAERAVGAERMTSVPVDLPGVAGRLAGCPADDDYLAVYRDTLVQCGGALATAVAEVAAALPEPVVVGCSLGKDRTGLLAGLVLGLLGVPDDHLLRQEARARAGLLDCAPAVRAYLAAQSSGLTRAELTRRCRGRGTALVTALGEVRKQQGGVAGYLVRHGLPERAVLHLRAQLFTPPAPLPQAGRRSAGPTAPACGTP